MNNTPPHTACPGCIVYTLLHQNTIIQRWHDIQDTLKPTPPLQHHRSIHSPDPVLGLVISFNLGGAQPQRCLPLHPLLNMSLTSPSIHMQKARSLRFCSINGGQQHSGAPFLSTHASDTPPPATSAQYTAPSRLPSPSTSCPISPPVHQCEITSHPTG